MSESRIAARYAKSLIDLSSEVGETDKIAEDMELFRAVCSDVRDLRLMLASPIIPHGKKLEVIKTVFAGKVSELSLTFFTLITKKHRENNLLAIAEQFLVQFNRLKGISKGTVTTAFPIDDELRTAFKSVVRQISGNTPELVEKVEPNLVGGYVLQVGDKRLDNSIESKLNELRLAFSSEK